MQITKCGMYLCVFFVALTDGSNGSLKVWSGSGSIDVYVGQTGNAEVFSQSGEAWKLKDHIALCCL